VELLEGEAWGWFPLLSLSVGAICLLLMLLLLVLLCHGDSRQREIIDLLNLLSEFCHLSLQTLKPMVMHSVLLQTQTTTLALREVRETVTERLSLRRSSSQRDSVCHRLREMDMVPLKDLRGGSLDRLDLLLELFDFYRD
jgi:hypothetical protein